MKHFVILILSGFVGLTPLQHVFAHGVHSGIFGCPVAACGITDWDLSRAASDSMFYLSLIVYAVIIILFCYYLHKRKSISTVIRK